MAAETALREAGASETLIVALRRAAPAERAPSPPPIAPRAAGATPVPTPGVPVVGATFAAATRAVRVPVSVLDKSGQPVIGLGREDFHVKDDGKSQSVTLFSGERSALRIALALDTSRSMQDKIREVERALRYFIDILEPQDEILVMTFGNRVRVVQDFTSDRDQLRRVLDMLEPEGSTLLYDAAAEAIRRVAPGPAESKAVVLVTDGVDTSSLTTFDGLRELARRSEVPVFSIGLEGASELRDLIRPPGGFGGFPGGGGRRGPGGGGGRGGWPGGGMGGGMGGGRSGGRPPAGPGMRREGFDAKPLKELADETGARAEVVKGIEHYAPESETPGSGPLKTAVESIALTLRHRYLVGYDPPDGKSGWRSLHVDVDRSGAVARTRKGYYSGT
jgi:VWFA-related protein